MPDVTTNSDSIKNSAGISLNESHLRSDVEAVSSLIPTIVIVIHEGDDLATWFTVTSAVKQAGADTKIIIVDPTKDRPGKIATWINDPANDGTSRLEKENHLITQLSAAPVPVSMEGIGAYQGALMMEDVEPTVNAKIFYIKTKVQKSVASAINIGILKGRKVSKAETFVVVKAGVMLGITAVERFSQRLQDSQIGLCGGTVLDGENGFTPFVLGGAQLGPLNGKRLCKGTKKQAIPPRMELERKLNHPIDYVVAFKLDIISNINCFDDNMVGHYIFADFAKSNKSLKKTGWAESAIAYNFASMNRFLLPVKLSDIMQNDCKEIAHEVLGKIEYTRKWTPILGAPILFSEFFAALFDFITIKPKKATARISAFS